MYNEEGKAAPTVSQTPITVDLNHRPWSPKLFSRLVWQQLFNLYREGGGDPNAMDSLLCDLYTLVEYFEAT